MRKPSKSGKREVIVAGAGKIFLNGGFATASMDAIARETGVSKQTLYSHFESKEQLFGEVMGAMCRGEQSSVSAPLTFDGDPEEVLSAAARTLLEKMLCRPNALALLRTALAEAPRFPEVGRTYWESGPNFMAARVSRYLEEQDRRGALSVPDAGYAAREFIGSLVGGRLLPILLGVERPPSKNELDRIVRRRVADFLGTVSIGKGTRS